MKQLLLRLFTWWNGATLGTLLFTSRKGEFVGEDEFGNRYYRAPSAIPDSIRERRWVIYDGYAEASAVPPGWHGWLHHRAEIPPSETSYVPNVWQKPHHANLTGTPLAYRPPGSIAVPYPRSAADPDYEPWRP